MNRGYSAQFIENIHQSVSYANRQTILEKTGKKQKPSSKKIPLIFSTTYTSHLSGKQIKTALLKNWKLISENLELSTTFPTAPLIAFKRSKNIRDKIVRAKLPCDENINVLLDLLEEQ